MAEMTEMKALQAKLQAERDEIVKAARPYREEYDEIMQELRPLEARARELSKKFREIEQPRLAEIDNQLGPIAVALGGRSLRMQDVDVKHE